MDNNAAKVDVRCRFALEKNISPGLYELFSQIPTIQHSKLILVMLERALCYERQMEAFQNRPLIGSQPNVSPVAVQSTPQEYQQEPALPKPKKANQKEQPREVFPVVDDSGAIRPVSASALAGFGLN
jgi:hypothetical protein